MIIKPRGTMDILPTEVGYWQYAEKKAREISLLHGFGEIRFPTFEQTELFARGVGDTTDVVQKEMYTFADKDNRSMTLRPEGTACIARSIVENGLCSDTMPLRLYYIISCFRYEKPASGRYREFYQYGVEMFGANSPVSDAEIISLAWDYVNSLGIKGLSLDINSIGCPECRPAYREALVNYFKKYENDLCDTCKGRLLTNPLRILDCKCPECAKIAKDAPVTIDYLCPDCKAHMDSMCATLDEMNIDYKIDTGIVRGLDYYTRTVFEIIGPAEPDKDGVEKRITLLGGGRYDGLVKEIGGPQLSGIGFATGISRLITAMKLSGVEITNEYKPDLYIAALGDNAHIKACGIVKKLRQIGIFAETDVVGRSLKAQMKYADKSNALYTLMLGDSELESGVAPLRDMSNSEQKDIKLDEIIDFFKELRKN